MESLELFDFRDNMVDISKSNTLAVNRFPVKAKELSVDGSDGAKITEPFGQSGSKDVAEKRNLGAKNVAEVVSQYSRWKEFFYSRISDPIVKGMYQNLYLDLMIMKIIHLAPLAEHTKNTGTTIFNADNDASSILLELANSSKSVSVPSVGIALQPVASTSNDVMSPGVAKSSVFSSLLAAIDNVPSLAETPRDADNDVAKCTDSAEEKKRSAEYAAINTNDPAMVIT